MQTGIEPSASYVTRVTFASVLCELHVSRVAVLSHRALRNDADVTKLHGISSAVSNVTVTTHSLVTLCVAANTAKYTVRPICRYA